MPSSIQFNDRVIRIRKIEETPSPGQGVRYWAKRLCAVGISATPAKGLVRRKFKDVLPSLGAGGGMFDTATRPPVYGQLRGLIPEDRSRAGKVRGLPTHRYSKKIKVMSRWHGYTRYIHMHKAALYWEPGYVSGDRFYPGAPAGLKNPLDV